ncbi:MAG: RDD family protein [Erysipelotrichaceae bacterium]|nr:RDD family protein [Erysipelotrichaceae bacterium]
MSKKTKVKKPSISQQLMDTVKVPMEWIEAPAWKRIVAFIFDMFLVGPVVNFLIPVNTYLPPLAVAVYFIGFELSPWKGTIGKRIMSMKILDDHKKNISVDRILIRYVAKILSLAMFGAGYWIPMLGNNRPLPDQLSHTMVIALTPSKPKKS